MNATPHKDCAGGGCVRVVGVCVRVVGVCVGGCVRVLGVCVGGCRRACLCAVTPWRMSHVGGVKSPAGLDD